MGSLAKESRLIENIISFIIVGGGLVFLVFSGAHLADFLAVGVIVVFFTIIVMIIREEGFFGKYSSPKAIEDWRKFQLERRKEGMLDKYSDTDELESSLPRKKRKRRMVR